LIEVVCIEYYADYYESGTLDNGYSWEYYLDPHGIPSFGYTIDPFGFDPESNFGTYLNHYYFELPSYWKLSREDSVGCYSDVCVSYDWVTEECTSEYNDYEVYTVDEYSTYQLYTDCGEDADYFEYMSTVGMEDADYYTSYKSGPDDYYFKSEYTSEDECFASTVEWVADMAIY